MLILSAAQDSKAGSSISLVHCSASVLPDTPRSSGRQWCFELSSTEFERVYALQAENRRDMLRWIKAFNDSAVTDRRPPPGAERVEDNDNILLTCKQTALSSFSTVCRRRCSLT